MVTSKQVSRVKTSKVISKLNGPEWVKLVYSETPTQANVKQGYLFDEGDFFKIVGTQTETLVRKQTVISITKKKFEVKQYDRQSSRI